VVVVEEKRIGDWRKREILGVVDDGWDDPVIEMDRFFLWYQRTLLFSTYCSSSSSSNL
jgi:hypothetical protein